MNTALRRLGVILLALLALAIAVPTAATPAAAEGKGGWVRLAHLSPDTPAVNVALTSVSDKDAVLKLSDVGYGAVSDYQKVPAGTYVATMTPPGGDASSQPAISQSVTVADGRAYTVAAVGPRAALKGTVLDDDLQPPARGKAKIRLLQASTLAPTVDVTADGDLTLAEGARFATASGYATVDAGIWAVTVTPTEGDAEPITTDVTARSGTVTTLVVLDRKGGDGIRVLTVADASGVAAAPKKGTGVKTGLGGSEVSTAAPSAPLALVGLGVAVLGVVALRGRRTNPRTR